MHADSTVSGPSRKQFRSRRAYRRYMKRHGGAGGARIAPMDTHKGLEALEQRVLLSASPVFELSDLLAANGGDGSEGVVINGVSLDDRSGISVSSAGDVNDDGFEDVIIGAFRATPSGLDSGAAYVVFGQAGGFNASLQLSSLNGTNGFRLDGAAASDLTGRSVAGAGDVNGDGIDDLIVGAFHEDADQITPELLPGKTYVVYGQAGPFASSIDLDSLNGTDGFVINGLSNDDNLGFSVRGAGDINGDGLDDMIIGAYKADPNLPDVDSGAAYVVFGDTGFGSSFDLTTLDGTNGFVIEGVSEDDQLGISVSSAGDVNADGLDDLVIGAHQDDPNGADSGAAYVVFGKSGAFSATLDPSTLNGSNGFAINGVGAGDNAGRSVGLAGDFNGDGFADVLIGAPFADGANTNSGAAYVVFGQGGAFASSIDLSTLNGTTGFKLNGIDTGDQAGFSVSGAGDVNGDGLDDLLVSAFLANPSGTRSGETYLIHGRTSAMPATINLSALAGSDGFVLNGIDAQDRSGVSARSAGDVDGDGFDDLIIGAFLADPNGSASGESYLVFGGDFSDAVTLPGTDLNDALDGTAGVDIMVAGRGSDTLTSNGGADVMLGGAGDDNFVIPGTGFARIDGGSGVNKLTFVGDSTTFDLTTINENRLSGIHEVELSGTSSTVTLNLQTVLNFSDDSNTLTVITDVSGTVNRGSGWVPDGPPDSSSGDLVETYTQGNATLIVITLGDFTDPVVTVDPLETDVQSPELTGTVSDNDPVVTVEITVDGNTYGATNNGDGTWTLPAGTISPGLGDGVYDVVAVGTDSSGNDGSDNTSNDLLVDTSAPVVTVDTLYTANTSPQLTGTIDDLDTAATVEVTVDGNTYAAVNLGNGVWFLPVGTISPALSEGEYNVSVTATDQFNQAGNDATTDELTIDTTDPVVTVDDPGTVDNGSPEITGTVVDVDDAAVVVVEVNSLVFTATNNGDGTWTLPAGTITPDLAGGVYSVQAAATDAAGNTGVTASAATLTVDSSPVLTVNAKTTSDQTPEITGTIIDNNTSADITVTINGIVYTATNNGDGTWTLADDTIQPGDALSDGTYDVSATVTDDNGNPGADTTTDELVIDTSAPVVTVDTLVTSDTTPQLTGTVSTPEAAIEVTVDGETYAAINNGDGTWTLADDTILIEDALTDGPYDVAVTATNIAQTPVAGSDATTDELTIDTSNPAVTFRNRLTSDTTPTLTGTYSDNDLDAVSISLTIPGIGTLDATNNGDGTWTILGSAFTAPLAVGIYQVNVTALDAAGNLGLAELPNVINIQAAAHTVGVDPLTTNDTTPELTGTVSDATADVEVTVEGNTYTATNNGDGTWTLADDTISPALADGTYDIHVTATVIGLFEDIVGEEVADALVIDTVGPEVTINPAVTSDTTPELTGTIDSTTATIDVTVNGNTYSATNNGDGTWTLADNTITPGLPVGIYDVLVEANDDLGNVGADASIDELQITIPLINSIDVNDLFIVNGGDGTEGTVFQGINESDLAGNSAKSAGDINGDGFDDLIIGATGADPVSNNDGAAYIIFGSAAGFPAEFDLATLNGTNGFRVDALGAIDDLGVSVAAAGDVNGDGLGDIIIGADKADPTLFNEGVAYVIYGSTSPFTATFDLTTLNGTNGFVFEGEANSDRAGFSVNTAGDINGDGLSDVVIGSLNGDDGVTADTGRSYVIFGSTSAMPATITAAALDGTTGFILTGEATGDSAGFSVGTAGDMNGDGIDDLRIGAPDANSDMGKAYVVFGKTTGFSAEIDLGSLNGTDGFAVLGDTADMELGFSVSTIGDHNGDGLDDLLIGAPADTTTGTAYVIYGSTSAFSASITLASLDGTNGFELLGVDTNGSDGEDTGFNVSGVGDINGDGFDDLLIGAPKGNQAGGFENGQSYLLLGRSLSYGASLDLATVPGDSGFVINGRSFLDNAGRYVSFAGDVNGDGFKDLLVAARNADPNGNNDAGETYLIYGRDFSGTITHAGGSGADVFNGSASRDAMISGAGDDELIGNGGSDVLSAGQGDDLLAISDTGFMRLSGGSGFDTLRLDGAGITLDLTAISDVAVNGIEQIDVRGSGANSLTLDLLEVLNLSDTTNTLLILADADDTVDIGTGWTFTGQEVIDSFAFDVFTQGNATIKQQGTAVDITDPVVTVDPLATNDSTPQLTGTVVDDDPLTTVEVTVNGETYTATNNGDGTWTLADNTITPALSDGTYDVSVSATDTANNTGSDASTDELTVDTTAPVVTVDPLTTDDPSPQLTGTVVDADPTATVEVTINFITYTATNNGDGTWTLPDSTITTDLYDGTYDVSVSATDTFGNTGSDATTDELVIDGGLPEVFINPLMTSDGTPELTGLVFDNDDANVTVELFVNGTFYTATNNGDGTWTLPDNTISPPLTDGTWDIGARLTDADGNVGWDFSINELVVDLPPVVTVDPLTTMDTTPELTGTVIDASASTTVEVTVNGITYAANNNGDGTWTLPDDTIAPALSAGTYDVSVTATDPNNSVGSDATTDELVIDVATIPGDVDGDGFVGLDDLDILLNNWNLFTPPGDPRGDLTGDNFVGLDDLDIVLNNWNAGTPPAAEASVASNPATTTPEQASSEEQTAPTSVQTVSVVEEAEAVETPTQPAADQTSDSTGWSWMLDHQNDGRSAFSDADEDEASDSVLDLAAPLDQAGL